MFIRIYKRADKKSIQQLFYDTVHSVNARDYSLEQLDVWAPAEPNHQVWVRLEEDACFVVELQKEVVGFVTVTKTGVLDLLFVHRHYQNRGIGAALLKQAERQAKKFGVNEIQAEVSITAKPFFERKGFILKSENIKKIGETEFINYIMFKPLPVAESRI
jgi:putative acetyltransferase